MNIKRNDKNVRNLLWDRDAKLARRLSDKSLMKLLNLSRLDEIYEGLDNLRGLSFINSLYDGLSIHADCAESDKKHIPESGACLMLANHPLGYLEGVVLLHIVSSIRNDVKVIVNHKLSDLPELSDIIIHNDDLTGGLSHLQNGGFLLAFPAGKAGQKRISGEWVDKDWDPGIATLIRKSETSVLPVNADISGKHLHHLVGKMVPSLNELIMAHQLLKSNEHKIEIRIGNLIAFDQLRQFASDSKRINYLRFRSYLLSNREEKTKRDASDVLEEEVIDKVDRVSLKAEISSLQGDLLHQQGSKSVYLADAAQIPFCLKEIGRLREITFREAGEGTGKSIDLDDYDVYYKHLFIWDESDEEIVGAYRLAKANVVFKEQGIKGLYTSEIFDYDEQICDSLLDAVELGRSFIQSKYQKSYAPLLLLWRGIGAYLQKNPDCSKLFGAVSISNDYQDASRMLMAAVLQDQFSDPQLAKFVRAKNPFESENLKCVNTNDALFWCDDSIELSNWIKDLELDDSPLPILVKQYIKLGASFLSFNVDKAFCDSLDALVLVDVKRSNESVLKKVFGKAVYEQIVSAE